MEIDEIFNVELTESDIRELNRDLNRQDSLALIQYRKDKEELEDSQHLSTKTRLSKAKLKKNMTLPADYDPEHLKNHLIQQAENQPDIDDYVPYVAGVKRGKIYTEKKKKIVEDGYGGGSIRIDSELEEALKNCSAEDFPELCNLLEVDIGEANMSADVVLEKKVYQKAKLVRKPSDLIDGRKRKEIEISDETFRVSAGDDDKFKRTSESEEKNQVDLAAVLKQLRNNDPELRMVAQSIWQMSCPTAERPDS